jgi:hypothetical protein
VISVPSRLLASLTVLSIPAAAIDHRRARGANPNAAPQDPSGAWALLKCRPLVIFAACSMLFHFANAPLLPLLGQKLASANPSLATAITVLLHYRGPARDAARIGA